jgi:hypothetical protein
MLNIDKVDQALAIAARGHKVFPLHGITERAGCTCGNAMCKNEGKHPYARFAPNGVNSATSDRDIICSWWRRLSWLNYGVSAENLAILDVDRRHDGDKTLSELEHKHGPLPHTWRCITGNGEHIYFSKPPGVLLKCGAGVLGDGLDLRTTGGYVVGPGSLHLSGKDYAWSVDHHPDDVSLAVPPAWLLAALAVSTGANGHPKAKPPEYFQKLAAEEVFEGEGRNDRATRLFGKLLHDLRDPILAKELVVCWDQVRCRPPLAHELTTIFNSICASEFKKLGF